jgi:hypothetical protein
MFGWCVSPVIPVLYNVQMLVTLSKESRNLLRKWGIGIPQYMYLYIYGRRIVSRNFLYFLLVAQAQTATHVNYNGPLQFSSLLKGHDNETDSSVLTYAKSPVRKKRKNEIFVDFRMRISPRVRSKKCEVFYSCIRNPCWTNLYEKSVPVPCPFNFSVVTS